MKGSDQVIKLLSVAIVLEQKLDCFKHSELEQFCLNPDMLETERKNHLEDCLYCQKGVLMMKKDLWHPNKKQLEAYQKGEKIENSTLEIRIKEHIKTKKCLKCSIPNNEVDVIDRLAEDLKIKKIEEMLPEIIENWIKGIPNCHSEKTPDCLWFGRIEQWHLNSDLLTQDEKEHVKSCAFCQNNIKIYGEDVWHPSNEQIRKYQDSEKFDEEIDGNNVRSHIEFKKCKICTKK